MTAPSPDDLLGHPLSSAGYHLAPPHGLTLANVNHARISHANIDQCVCTNASSEISVSTTGVYAQHVNVGAVLDPDTPGTLTINNYVFDPPYRNVSIDRINSGIVSDQSTQDADPHGSTSLWTGHAINEWVPSKIFRQVYTPLATYHGNNVNFSYLFGLSTGNTVQAYSVDVVLTAVGDVNIRIMWDDGGRGLTTTPLAEGTPSSICTDAIEDLAPFNIAPATYECPNYIKCSVKESAGHEWTTGVTCWIQDNRINIAPFSRTFNRTLFDTHDGTANNMIPSFTLTYNLHNYGVINPPAGVPAGPGDPPGGMTMMPMLGATSSTSSTQTGGISPRVPANIILPTRTKNTLTTPTSAKCESDEDDDIILVKPADKETTTSTTSTSTSTSLPGVTRIPRGPLDFKL